MSDNYKVIRRTKEAVLELKAQGWTHNGICSEIGITHALLNDIESIDPVAIKVRSGTIDKMRAFLDQYEVGIEKPLRKSSRPEKETVNFTPPVDEFRTKVPESMEDAIPEHRGIEKGPVDPDGNLLNDLNVLARRFDRAGYQLNANIELIHKSE